MRHASQITANLLPHVLCLPWPAKKKKKKKNHLAEIMARAREIFAYRRV